MLPPKILKEIPSLPLPTIAGSRHSLAWDYINEISVSVFMSSPLHHSGVFSSSVSDKDTGLWS